MTANALQDDRERCIAAGMDGCIANLIRPKELYVMAEKC
jgi:CheY-like chemotaxis protein